MCVCVSSFSVLCVFLKEFLLKRAAEIRSAGGNGGDIHVAGTCLFLKKMLFCSFYLLFPEINDGEGHPSSSHQALKGTSRWATSLENLLEDPEGVKRFRVDILNMDSHLKQNSGFKAE